MRTVVIAALLVACGSKGSAPKHDAGVAAAPDARPPEPDVAEYAGDPYVDRALVAGTLRVTLTRGAALTPAPGVTLHLVALDTAGVATDATFTTDASGAFEATGLRHDGLTAYHLLGELDGDRLESSPIILGKHGARVDLRARAPGDATAPFPGLPELEGAVPDGEAWVSIVGAVDTTDLTLIDVATGASRTTAAIVPDTLGPTARYAGLTPGAIYVARLRHTTGLHVSRPLLAMAGPGVGRNLAAMEVPMARCRAQLLAGSLGLDGVTRCDVWQPGGIPRVLATPLELPLPEGATKIELRDEHGPVEIAGGRLRWRGAVAPGVIKVQVGYVLAVIGGRAEVTQVSPQAMAQVGFVVEASTRIEVTGVTGGKYQAPDFSGDSGSHMVWADYTKAGDRLTFTVTGVTPPTPCELLGASRWTADGNPAPAPDIVGESSNGGAQVRLSSLRGKPVVLNLFASWTPPSAQELPSLIALSRVIHPLGAELVVVASDPTWDDVKRLIDPTSGLTVWLDRPKGAQYVLGDAAHAFGTTKLPETYLIDAEGLVRYWIVNARDWTSPEALACIQTLKTPWTGPVSAAPPPYVQPLVHLSGTIRLGNVPVPPGGVLYILARRAYDQVPLAAIKVEGPTFPQSFRMTDAELLGTEAFVGDVEVTARIDRDGHAATEDPGDVFGTASAPTGSTNVNITIDQLVP